MTDDGKKAAIIARRKQAGEMHLMGNSNAAIAEQLRVSLRTVRRDLQLVRDAWTEARDEAWAHARVVELATLRLLEREAWEGWRRSQEQGVSEKLSKTEQEKSRSPRPSSRPSPEPAEQGGRGGATEAARKLAERTTRTQYGDPRFLMLIMRCVERRARLLEGATPSEEYMLRARPTVMAVLDQIDSDPEFLDFCRHKAAAAFPEPPSPDPAAQIVGRFEWRNDRSAEE
jgi:hypothetical protein